MGRLGWVLGGKHWKGLQDNPVTESWLGLVRLFGVRDKGVLGSGNWGQGNIRWLKLKLSKGKKNLGGLCGR